MDERTGFENRFFMVKLPLLESKVAERRQGNARHPVSERGETRGIGETLRNDYEIP